MSYPNPWSKMYVPSDMRVTAIPIGYAPPEIGPSDSFLAWANHIRNCQGIWITPKLSVKSLVNDVNADNFKITAFNYSKKVDWGGAFIHDEASLMVWLDNSKILDLALETGTGAVEKTIPLDIKLAGTEVVFGLYQFAGAGLGSAIEQRLWNCKLIGTYTTTTPPVVRKLLVRVYNIETTSPIKGASVILLSGTTMIARGTTDSDGTVTLSATNQTFTLRVSATDYIPYPREVGVDLTSGDSLIDVPLTYSLISKPPDIVRYVLGGVAIVASVIGGYSVYTQLKKRKESVPK